VSFDLVFRSVRTSVNSGNTVRSSVRPVCPVCLASAVRTARPTRRRTISPPPSNEKTGRSTVGKVLKRRHHFSSPPPALPCTHDAAVARAARHQRRDIDVAATASCHCHLSVVNSAQKQSADSIGYVITFARPHDTHSTDPFQL